MIKLLGSLNKKERYWMAVSGGVDSMAAYHFLKQMKYWVQPLFFDHHTLTSEKASRWLHRHPDMQSLQGSADIKWSEKPKGLSDEEYWRNERYSFFKACRATVITAHHLDDAVETWVWSSLHGQSKLIPYRHANVIRPFLATPKAELKSWAERHGVEWIDDESNFNLKYQRNYIRHVLMPQILTINPGIQKTIRTKLLTRDSK